MKGSNIIFDICHCFIISIFMDVFCSSMQSEGYVAKRVSDLVKLSII